MDYLDPASDVSPAAAALPTSASTRALVGPQALKNCWVVLPREGAAGEPPAEVAILDISFVRVVIEPVEPWLSLPQEESVEVEFRLDRHVFKALVSVRGRGERWIRLAFDKIAPSARSALKSFLSPKKVGESIIEDGRTEAFRHYHGLNESEVWFEPDGHVLFTYLDQNDIDAQFILRMSETKGPLRVGKVLRRHYMEMTSVESDLPLVPLSDREVYLKLSECRDIVTNLRPTAQVEYTLKQRLLRAISDSLYSTSHRVEMTQSRTPARVSPTPNER